MAGLLTFFVCRCCLGMMLCPWFHVPFINRRLTDLSWGTYWKKAGTFLACRNHPICIFSLFFSIRALILRVCLHTWYTAGTLLVHTGERRAIMIASTVLLLGPRLLFGPSCFFSKYKEYSCLVRGWGYSWRIICYSLPVSSHIYVLQVSRLGIIEICPPVCGTCIQYKVLGEAFSE